MKAKDANCYLALKSFTHETCDFCDKDFHNRYDSIIHNASHIIIPLLRGSLFHCEKCNAYYISFEDLQNHNNSKHPLKNNKKENRKAIRIKKTIEAGNGNDNDSNSDQILPTRDKIKFEEDFSITNRLIKDLVTGCKVNVQLLDPPWLLSPIKNYDILNKENGINQRNINNFNLTSDSVNENSTKLEPSCKSISYSCLMTPGIYICRYCSTSYPDRFSLIKHEKYHIKLNKARPLLCTHCDRFIAGNYHNLHSHIQKFHPGSQMKKYETHICKRCNLRFKRYKRHVRNYHIYDCLLCGMEFNTASEHEEHEKTCKNRYIDKAEHSKLIKVCNLCYSFFKSKLNLHYYYMGLMGNEMGMRYACENCGKKHFELNMVKRIQKSNSHHASKLKRVTNEDRLKNIQQRLKKLNLLNRFYFVVLFVVH